jgi:hypothetical protein
MGFRKSWDVSDISRQIHSLARECTTPYNDGFTAFECKKDLHQLKQIIDNALAEAPNFGELEQQWLQEQEKKRIIKHLKS